MSDGQVYPAFPMIDHVAICGCLATGRYKGAFDFVGDIEAHVLMQERTCGHWMIVISETGKHGR